MVTEGSNQDLDRWGFETWGGAIPQDRFRLLSLDVDQAGQVRIRGWLLVPASVDCPDGAAARRELLNSAELVLQVLARLGIRHRSHPQISIEGTVLHRLDAGQDLVPEGQMTLDLMVPRRFDT